MFAQLASRRITLVVCASCVAGLLAARSGDAQELPAITTRLPVVRPISQYDLISARRYDADPPPVVLLAGAAADLTVRASKKGKEEVISMARSIDCSGPRLGVTYLPKAAIDSLKAHNISVSTTITQFGWQFEREIHVSPEGPRVLNEWVFLAGGLESGVFLPSLTWLIGARDRTGNEVGVGPNVSVAGVGLAAAAGVTVHDGGVNFPMNIAVAKSKTGARVSFLTGFTIH